MNDAFDSLYTELFRVRRSARYHERRRSYFEGVNTAILGIQIAASSFALVSMLKTWLDAEAVVYLAGVVGLLAAVNLVIGTQRKATSHTELTLRFRQLERDMLPHEGNLDVEWETVDDFRQMRQSIEESEPPKLRVIDLLCRNELVMSTYRHGSIYRIGRVKQWLGHAFDLDVQSILDNPSAPPGLEVEPAEQRQEPTDKLPAPSA